MTRSRSLIAVALLLTAGLSSAQTSRRREAPPPADAASVDTIIAALYGSVSHAPEASPDFDRHAFDLPLRRDVRAARPPRSGDHGKRRGRLRQPLREVCRGAQGEGGSRRRVSSSARSRGRPTASATCARSSRPTSRAIPPRTPSPSSAGSTRSSSSTTANAGGLPRSPGTPKSPTSRSRRNTSRRPSPSRRTPHWMMFRQIVISTVACAAICSAPVYAQSRGVYPLGMSAVNSGVTAEPGFTYSNQLLFYSRDTAKDDNGETLPVTGHNGVLMDLNSFAWVSQKEILGGARYSAAVTLPVARNELESDVHDTISGGSGFADSYFLPIILGWNKERASFRVLFGFLAPTGRFAAGASDNVGSGYWTFTLSSGQTFYLTSEQAPRLLGVRDVRIPHHSGGHRHASRRYLRSRLFADADVSSRIRILAAPGRRRRV